MAWQFDGNRPIYAQLVEHIQYDIVSGVYPPGEKLPSVRELATLAAVNPNTMQKALAELETDGLIFTQRTAGRFVTQDVEAIRAGTALPEHFAKFFAKHGAPGLYTPTIAGNSDKICGGIELIWML